MSGAWTQQEVMRLPWRMKATGPTTFKQVFGLWRSAEQHSANCQNISISWVVTQVGGPQWWTLPKNRRRGQRRSLPTRRHQQRKPMEKQMKARIKQVRVPAEWCHISSWSHLKVRNIIYYLQNMHHKMSYIHKKSLPTPTHRLTTLPLFSLLSVEQGYSTSPWSKQFMAITLGSLWYDHLYNLTVPSHWGYLTWQMNCVLTEMGSVCPCRSVYRLVCRGEGGPVSGRRRLCITVCHPLGLWYTRARSHTCTDMHFIINIQSKTLLYSLYISDLYMGLYAKYFSIGLGLCAAACSILSLPLFAQPLYVHSHLLLHWSAYTPLVRADSFNSLFQMLPIQLQAKAGAL